MTLLFTLYIVSVLVLKVKINTPRPKWEGSLGLNKPVRTARPGGPARDSEDMLVHLASRYIGLGGWLLKRDFPATPRPISKVPTSFISLLPSGQTERPPEPVLGVLRAALGLGHVRRDRADELEGRVAGLADALHLRQGISAVERRRARRVLSTLTALTAVGSAKCELLPAALCF